MILAVRDAVPAASKHTRLTYIRHRHVLTIYLFMIIEITRKEIKNNMHKKKNIKYRYV